MTNEEQGYWEQFLQAWRDDVYLRLSIYGTVLFAALCVINVLCWLRYGATISAMFDSKSRWSFKQRHITCDISMLLHNADNSESTSQVQISDPIEGARSYYVPWYEAVFWLEI